MDNPASPATPEHYLCSPDELHALELRWYEGQMLRYAEWLFSFTERHRGEIHATAGSLPEPGRLVAATKHVIVRMGSMHLDGELQDQRREIENELWYRGEKGDQDRCRIQRDWTEAHAAAWRRWRIKEYLFVADRCAADIAARLGHQEPGAS